MSPIRAVVMKTPMRMRHYTKVAMIIIGIEDGISFGVAGMSVQHSIASDGKRVEL